MSKLIFEKKIEELGGIEATSGGEFVSVAEESLVTIEKKIGVSLPQDYRAFVKEYGASQFHTLVIFKPIIDLPDYISSAGYGYFDYFFGVSDNTNIYALQWAIESYKNRVPKSLLPIGGDVGGGVICLGISGDECNKVYYWDPSNEWDVDDIEDGDDIESIMFQNVHIVADTFTDFISCLEESPYA
ncbi:hypothetical protein MNBD_GAMMA12-3827 [hydrothermal vent metagenome]|uniref:Knr4/Smi1-like domain-containing protein n=1 Tax=hydrothermal vent metagenome TaxID=652676 RepID=A0A3B0Y7L3_9ZZZZ